MYKEISKINVKIDYLNRHGSKKINRSQARGRVFDRTSLVIKEAHLRSFSLRQLRRKEPLGGGRLGPPRPTVAQKTWCLVSAGHGVPGCRRRLQAQPSGSGCTDGRGCEGNPRASGPRGPFRGLRTKALRTGGRRRRQIHRTNHLAPVADARAGARAEVAPGPKELGTLPGNREMRKLQKEGKPQDSGAHRSTSQASLAPSPCWHSR